MRCSRGLKLYLEVREAAGNENFDETWTEYKRHINSCRVCRDHYRDLIRAARETAGHPLPEDKTDDYYNGGD